MITNLYAVIDGPLPFRVMAVAQKLSPLEDSDQVVSGEWQDTKCGRRPTYSNLQLEASSFPLRVDVVLDTTGQTHRTCIP
jgi:hypothetical protein